MICINGQHNFELGKFTGWHVSNVNNLSMTTVGMGMLRMRELIHVIFVVVCAYRTGNSILTTIHMYFKTHVERDHY